MPHTACPPALCLQKRLAVLEDLAALLACLLRVDQLVELLVELLLLLGDSDLEAARGGAALVQGLVHQKGREMESSLEQCLVGFIGATKLLLEEEDVSKTVLTAMRMLVKCHFGRDPSPHQPRSSSSHPLQPCPFPRPMPRCWPVCSDAGLKILLKAPTPLPQEMTRCFLALVDHEDSPQSLAVIKCPRSTHARTHARTRAHVRRK